MKIPVIPRAEMLGELLRMARVGVAVAGTHGKTTTTALVGLILEEAGLDPTVAIGGNLRSRGSNVRLGRGEYMVAEADESDASFLLLVPTLAIVTNIDAEHLDHYGNIDRVCDAFLSFINHVPFYGAAVLGIDSVNVRGLLPSIRKPVITYGVAADADLARRENRDRRSFDALRSGAQGRRSRRTSRFRLPDVHVAMNSLAAIAVALELGIGFEVAARALAKFSGISRRFEIKGEAAGRIVIDDYAHHPEEVKATLAAARAAFKRRIVAVFQPHRYTRMRDLFDAIHRTPSTTPTCVCLMDIYPAGEDAIPGRQFASTLRRDARARAYQRAITSARSAARRRGSPTLTPPATSCSRSARATSMQLGDQLLAELGAERKTHEQA